MSLVTGELRLSSSVPGTLMKRKPCSASGRGSICRSLIEGKPKPQLCELREAFMLDGTHRAQRPLRELQDQGRGERAVRVQELEELRENLPIDQRRFGNVAE